MTSGYFNPNTDKPIAAPPWVWLGALAVGTVLMFVVEFLTAETATWTSVSWGVKAVLGLAVLLALYGWKDRQLSRREKVIPMIGPA